MLQTTRYFLNNTESSQPCFQRKKRKCLHVWVKGNRIQTVGQESYWNKSGFHPYRFPPEAPKWAFLSVGPANTLFRPSTVHAQSPQLPPGQTLQRSFFPIHVPSPAQFCVSLQVTSPTLQIGGWCPGYVIFYPFLAWPLPPSQLCGQSVMPPACCRLSSRWSYQAREKQLP